MDFYGLRAKFKCRDERLGHCSDFRRGISMNTNQNIAIIIIIIIHNDSVSYAWLYKAHYIGAAKSSYYTD
jgi:hypothetical protein